jgi:hypothetical protein
MPITSQGTGLSREQIMEILRKEKDSGDSRESTIREIRDRNLPSEILSFYRKLISQIEFAKRNLQHPNSYTIINNLRIKDMKITTDLYIYTPNTIEYFKDVVYELYGAPYGSTNGGWSVYNIQDSEGNNSIDSQGVLINTCSISPVISTIEAVNKKTVRVIKKKVEKDKKDWRPF